MGGLAVDAHAVLEACQHRRNGLSKGRLEHFSWQVGDVRRDAGTSEERRKLVREVVALHTRQHKASATGLA